MKKTVQNGLIAAAFLPFLCKVPYMLKAWRSSPMERFDWFFIALFLVLGGLSLLNFRDIKWRINWYFVFVLGGSALLYALGLIRHIHALSIASSVIFAWGVVGFCRGWHGAYTAFPAFAALMLSCTSSTYWLGVFTGGDGLLFKMVMAGLFAFWQIWIVIKRHTLSFNAFAFGSVVALLLFLTFSAGWEYDTFPAYLPEFKMASKGEFLGREEAPSQADFRFFGKSKVERFFFAGEGDRQVNVLMVGDFEKVHKIHPAGHCLRSSGRQVLSEQFQPVHLNDRMLQVTEIAARYGEIPVLVWVWYSNEKYSSGSFLFFRRAYHQDEKWRSYQISTPITDTLENARNTLRDFLTAK